MAVSLRVVPKPDPDITYRPFLHYILKEMYKTALKGLGLVSEIQIVSTRSDPHQKVHILHPSLVEICWPVIV